MPSTAPNTGYLPDGFDPNDKPYYYLGTGWDPKQTRSVDLTGLYPNAPVYDQMDTNSCVANATSAALWYAANKNRGKLSLNPSRHFIYYNARALEVMADNQDMKQWPDSVKDKGVNIRQAMKAINLLGVASEDSDPWVFEGVVVGDDDDRKVIGRNDRPADAAYMDAKRTHAVEYCRLDPDHSEVTEEMFNMEQKEAVGILTLTRLKLAIHEGYPVVFGFYYYWKDFTVDDSPSAEPNKPENKGYATIKALEKLHQPQQDATWGAHAVVAVAWDDEKQRVLCKNSWGQTNHPYFWMPYHWIKDFQATDDFWIIRTINQSSSTIHINGPVLHGQVAVSRNGWQINNQTVFNESERVSTTPNSAIVSVNRGTQTAETFWVSAQGQVIQKSFFWSNTGPFSYSSPSTHVENSKGVVIPGAIAAIQHDHEHTDVFWINSNGSIYCHNNSASKTSCSSLGGQVQEVTGGGPASVSTKGGIAAVSRVKGHREIWYVTPEGAIEGLYSYDDSNTWTRYELVPKKRAHPASFITAVTPHPDMMFVFWISKVGKLSGKQWVNDGQSWRDTFKDVAFAPHSAAMRTRIAAVSRRKDHVEVFYTTREGVVEALYWNESQGSWNKWNMENKEEYTARVDSGLTAVRLNDNRMEVLWVGSNNSLVAASFFDGRASPWEKTTVAGPGSVMAGSPLGTFLRSEKGYSVIFTDYTGTMVVADFQEP